MREKSKIEAIEDGMARSLMVVLRNVTDMPGTDLLEAIQKGVEEGIYRAAMHGAFEADQNALRQITNTTTVSECQRIAREALGDG